MQIVWYKALQEENRRLKQMYAELMLDQVVEVLKSIVNDRSRLEQIRVDNGPEFRGRVLVEWCQVEGIVIKYIQPGKGPKLPPGGVFLSKDH